jgi:mRNA-degrading endonuclease RelE of RelBE toxin-antitoxin system
MAYNVELSESAERELGKLDASQAKRILKFLHQRSERCSGFWLRARERRSSLSPMRVVNNHIAAFLGSPSA